MWRNLWTFLLWLLGLSMVVFLVMAILFFLQQDWVPAAVLTLGTIFEGLGVKWVTDRRAEAVREEGEVFNDFQQACRGVSRSYHE